MAYGGAEDNFDPKMIYGPRQGDHRKIPSHGDSSMIGQIGIVGSCSVCGNPIYGNRVVHFDELRGQMPVVIRSCNCVEVRKSFVDTMETK